MRALMGGLGEGCGWGKGKGCCATVVAGRHVLLSWDVVWCDVRQVPLMVGPCIDAGTEEH